VLHRKGFDKLTNVYALFPWNTCWGKQAIGFVRSRFFWKSHDTKKKYRLTKWTIIFRPKDQGGLGVEVLELKKQAFT
jgi:hypothetical protein